MNFTLDLLRFFNRLLARVIYFILVAISEILVMAVWLLVVGIPVVATILLGVLGAIAILQGFYFQGSVMIIAFLAVFGWHLSRTGGDF